MSSIRARSGSPNYHGNPGLTYVDQISNYLSSDKTVRFLAEEIANYAKDKLLWNLEYCHSQVNMIHIMMMTMMTK